MEATQGSEVKHLQSENEARINKETASCTPDHNLLLPVHHTANACVIFYEAKKRNGKRDSPVAVDLRVCGEWREVSVRVRMPIQAQETQAAMRSIFDART